MTGRPADDPAFLIETMRMAAGRVALWPWHRQRLLRSARALGYPLTEVWLAAWWRAQCDAQARDAAGAPRRLRLLLGPEGQLSLEGSDLPATPSPVRVALARDCLGPQACLDSREPALRHKTTHRPWFATAQCWLRAHPETFDLIFLNERGELCEGSRSTLYVLSAEGHWLTPPVASGLLPGVQRQVLLDGGHAREAPLGLRDLTQARAVRVSNALRGWLDAVCPVC